MGIRFDGRILFLAQDAACVARQLQGEDIAQVEAMPLRDDISTDEITPAWVCYYFDERLGEYPYLGLKCATGFPVKAGSVKAGGFSVTVAGRRYGKGSSREASPYAEQLAGIRLVIAESFERIYRQNCHNLGILTSTDFGLIERIRRGEAIPIEEFIPEDDAITAEIVRRGGLFALTRARRSGEFEASPRTARRGMTYAEKIIAQRRSDGPGPVRPGDSLFVRADWRYAHEYVAPMAITFLRHSAGPDARLHDPATMLFFADHLNLVHHSLSPGQRASGLLEAARELSACQQAFCAAEGLRLHGPSEDREGAEGISHSIMTERYVLPGQIAVGTDSHTPHCGALGALAFGIGATEMANAWLTGDLRLRVPATCRVRLMTPLRAGVEAKDLALHLLRLPYVREGHAIGQVLEFCGPGVESMPTDERATLTNLVAEMGGLSGIVAPDAETARFVRERRGVEFQVEAWMRGDDDAEYAHTIEVDGAALEPMLARPGDPGRGLAVSELDSEVQVDIAYGGSCTGGKRSDLDRYHAVVTWALERGLRPASGTRFLVQFGSHAVREYCQRRGMLEDFRRAGVELVEPGCGACVNAGPGTSERADQLTVSSINRNFPGRSGPGRVWLASPSTVAASAIAGRIISFDALKLAHGDHA